MGEHGGIVIAGGGTGGHLYPALAVADALRARSRRVRFVGGKHGIETRLVPRAGYELETLEMTGFKGRGPLARIGALLRAAAATSRCTSLMRRWKPALVVGVGGYASGPAVLAARLTGRRTMVLEQNHFPGATNRLLSRLVDVACLPSEQARERLGRGEVTGNPVRPEFLQIDARPRARSLLVFGGSRGARSINVAMAEALPALARSADPPTILHQTGEADLDATREAYAAHYPAGRYEVAPFLDDMPARLAAADLVLCRAGATTLSELAAAGRAAVLVPYPHAADDHQRHNAEAVRAAGAAEILLDGELSAVAGRLLELLDDDARLDAMSSAAKSLAYPDALQSIVRIAEHLADGGRDVP